jgi:arylsulfatase
MAENTLIVFTADHGEMMGDHGLMQKSKPYDAAMRVPLLVRFPGRIVPGSRPPDRVSLTDLMPTFLDAAGIDYPAQPGVARLPGASLLGRAEGGPATPRGRFIVAESLAPNRWWCVMDRPWKYNYYMRAGWEELFHMEDDPQEMRNLLLGDVSPEARTTADELRAKLIAWEREHGFPSSFDGDDLVASPTRVEGVESRGVVRTNAQFPTWVENLPPDEKARMESWADSVRNAIRHEWTFKLADLNLAAYKLGGGSFEGDDDLQRLLEDL